MRVGYLLLLGELDYASSVDSAYQEVVCVT